MRLRGGWPLVIFVVLMIGVPILEVWLLITVSRQIGAWPLFGTLLAEVALGAWLLRREGSRAWRALNAAFTTGRVPTGELADAALILVGGVLLMLPGFATDVLGLAFLLPITRPVARRVLAFFVARRIHKLGGTAMQRHPGPMAGGGTVIPGEATDVPGGAPGPPEPDADRTGPVVIAGEVTEGRTDSRRSDPPGPESR